MSKDNQTKHGRSGDDCNELGNLRMVIQTTQRLAIDRGDHTQIAYRLRRPYKG